MTLSLNEIEVTAKKAARGAGYSWGLAEEAGKATRWLCAHGIDGCAALAGLLNRVDGADLSDWSPITGGPVWKAIGGTLCPLVTGAALSDRAYEAGDNETRLENVTHPVLLAPFAALLAQQTGQTVTVAWPGIHLCTDGGQIGLTGTLRHDPGTATVATGGTIDAPNPVCDRADPDSAAWQTLNAFAHRTYAPATEESRLRGAGAGLSDND